MIIIFLTNWLVISTHKSINGCQYWASHLSYPHTMIFFFFRGGEEGVYWFHSVHPSVHLSVRPSRIPCPSVVPIVLVGSISYQATSEGNFFTKFQNLNFYQFFRICNFDHVLFSLGVGCEWLIWVIMGPQGVSECRRSNFGKISLPGHPSCLPPAALVSTKRPWSPQTLITKRVEAQKFYFQIFHLLSKNRYVWRDLTDIKKTLKHQCS